jgi:hypothetical protein
MNAPVRNFEAKQAVREAVPLLTGLMGPSGGGKTVSALRLATGIQQVTGGDIHYIDTEARRALHYADKFKFQHVQFDAPFGALDYLAAIEQSHKAGAGVIVVDSMSHEHEGQGGLLDLHDTELTRMAGDDYRKRESMKMLAWQKPKANRRKLINRILQINANFIFCFRAKETVKPMKVDGKTQVVPLGFMPIAGDEFLFEMTVNCLLLPNAGGIPTWASENVGEKQMMKLPMQFRDLFADRKPLDENIGRALAEWARGGSSPASAQAKAAPPSNSSLIPQPQDGGAVDYPVPDGMELADDSLSLGAKKGSAALRTAWMNLDQNEKAALKTRLDNLHKKTAEFVDAKEGADVG